MFQSTFPRGERRAVGIQRNRMEEFQSTFPRGERQADRGGDAGYDGVSIHVPARGTTKTVLYIRADCVCFNPRSREGNDVAEFMAQYLVKHSFNPRSREGNDGYAT